MQTLLTIKTDKRLKEAAQETAKELGVPLTTAVNAFLKQFVRDRALTLSASYTPSAYLRAVIAEAEKDYTEGRNHSPVFDSVDEAVAWLSS